MAMMASASSGNPYDNYDNREIEQDLIDPDDANINDLDDPMQTNSDRAPLTGNIQSSSSRNPLPQSYLNSSIPGEDRRAPTNTIDESVWDTLSRDLLAVWEKMRQVLWPKYLLGGILQRGGGIGGAERGESGTMRGIAGRWPDADVVLQGGMSEGLRDWDLWGPLIFCLLLSLLLSMTASAEQKTMVFSGVFALVWIGEAVVTMQIKLLGGNISFFQSVCIIGYTLFPLVIAAMLSAIHLPAIARIPVYLVLVAWSLAAGISILGGSGVVKNRVGIAINIAAAGPRSIYCFVISAFDLVVASLGMVLRHISLNGVTCTPPSQIQNPSMVDQTHQQSGDVADDSSMPSREGSPARVADPSSLKPTPDRTSDIEASEGPVREKLKKTSIASIPRQTGSPGSAAEREFEINPTIAHVLANDAHAAGDGSSPESTDRGRPVRKRSFDDLDIDKAIPSHSHEQDTGNQGGRERKRSKDIRASRGPHSGTNEITTFAIQPANVVETETKAEKDDESTKAKKMPSDMNEESIRASIDTELVDEEMQQSTFSPRKKRSRDHLDADNQREQKIPATEEAKAHRRSEEDERDDKPLEDDDGLPQGGISAQSGAASTAPKVARTAGEGMRKSGFGNTSIISPFGQLTGSEPASKSSSISGHGPADSTSRKPMNTFGSSASLSGLQSSVSPFGVLDPSLSGNTKSFRSEPFPGEQTTSSAIGAGSSSGQATTNGFPPPPATSIAHNANVMAPSPFFAAGGTTSGSNIGGKTFGSGFGPNPGFGAPKLTSFANPGGGDMALGKHSAIKPIGAAQGSDNEGSGSEGDEEGDREHDIEKEDTDPRFQHQQMDTGEEGEESKFSSGRAKLYGWEDKAWKERGAGVFRFNLSTSDTTADTQQRQKARFIMRAHQTYRVLLNTPVFKEMMVGDPLKKGEEPTSKSLLIAVVTEEGKAVPKAVPYLIRLNDPSEARSLYREVRKLQEQL